MSKHTYLLAFALFSATFIVFSVALSQLGKQATPTTTVRPEVTASPPTVNKPVAKSNYVIDQARLLEVCGDIEEGKSYNFREALILSARQNVRRGEMSRADYEQFTKEKFPE